MNVFKYISRALTAAAVAEAVADIACIRWLVEEEPHIALA